MPTSAALLSSLVLALCAQLVQADETDEDKPRRFFRPGSFHVSSFDSELGARIWRDGRLDTGATVLRWEDGLTGEALEVDHMDMGKGPSLDVNWSGEMGDQETTGYTLAGTLRSGDDRRMMTSSQLKVTNPTASKRLVRIVALLTPGDGTWDQRPYPSLAHDSDQTWTLEDDQYIARDGRVVASWLGEVQDVEIVEHPAAGDETAARITWEFTLKPGDSHWLELRLVGAPAGGSVDELNWRNRFRRKSYASLEDVRGWESMYHGSFGAFTCADDRLATVMVAAIHVLRSLGNARYNVTALSDQAFGHPATDAAVEAEILASFFEFGLIEISEPYLDVLLADLYSRAGPLPLERKLAYLHGLARCLRLAADTSRHGALAQAIDELMRGGGPEGWSEPWEDGAVAVAPWLDPDQVRADLGRVLTRAGMDGADDLPRMVWPTVDDAEGMTGLMLEARKALSAGDGDRAWAILVRLLGRTTRVGVGCMQPGGPSDGRFCLAIMTLVRGFLIDDHGPDLHIFPGIAHGMLERGIDVKMPWMPTAFGQLHSQSFYTGKNMVGGWVTLRGRGAPLTTVMHFPPDMRLRQTKSQHGVGTVEVLDSNSVQLGLMSNKPLRFNIRIKPVEVEEQSG